MTQSLIT